MKFVILILAVAALGFVLLAHYGNHDETFGDSPTPAWISNLGLLAKPFDTSTLSGACFHPAAKNFAVEPSQTCVATIAANGSDYRTLKLRTLGASTVTAQYTAAVDDGTSMSHQNTNIGSNQPVSLVIRKDGGSLTMTCTALSKCVVAIQ